jgi:hypothetical protein
LQPIDDSKDDSKYEIRLSRPLLRILVDGLQFFEKIFGDSLQCYLNNIDPSTLLQTCRGQYDREVECAQLISWLVSYYAWLVLEDRPPASLQSLRRGALMSGTNDQNVVDVMMAAAAEVDAAGQIAKQKYDDGSAPERAAITEARHLKAVGLLPRIVTRTNTPSPGQAALSASSGPGYDGWLMPTVGQLIALIVNQSKGVMTGPGAGTAGGDKRISTSKVDTYVQKMCQAWIKEDNSSLGAATFELLDLHQAGARLRLPTIQSDNQLIVITRNEAHTALGPVFGGIATRMKVGKKEKKKKKKETGEESVRET